MKIICVHCRSVMEEPKGKHLVNGFVCEDCLNKEMLVFTAKTLDGNCVFAIKDHAQSFIDDEKEFYKEDGIEYKPGDIGVFESKMKVLDFYNLPEWNG